MKIRITLLTALLWASWAVAQNADDINYDERLIPPFTLPDMLRTNDGQAVTSVRQWEKKRRGEVLEYFAAQEYGRTPREKISVTHEVVETNRQALSGLATMEQVMFHFSGSGRQVDALLLVYRPNNVKGRVPVFVSYNFKGNHATSADPAIRYSPYFLRLPENEKAALERGTQASRWPVEEIVRRGYAVVTMCYQDIFPDNAGGRPESVCALFNDYDPTLSAPDAWNALGAWAWGSSRIADWVLKQPWADKRRLIVTGHSRQGKAALWAGAQDRRFAVVISNESGCGGAALSKRRIGETVQRINQSFPHWFCPAFKQYNNNEGALPFDQHELLALVAPRHFYVASAEGDRWADPHGEFLAAYYAGPVYRLYGMQGLPTDQMPAVHQPLMTDVGYHIRAGEHDVKLYDWTCYMDFCDRVLKR